jgi:hypothetical protein
VVFHGWKMVGALSLVLFSCLEGLFAATLLRPKRYHSEFVTA